MKKRHTPEQIIQILREAETAQNKLDVCRKYNISEPTLYRWKHKYEGMDENDARKMKHLETENTRLKRLVADQALAIQAMQEALKKRGIL